MSIFSLFTSRKPDVSKYAFVDTEVGTKDHKIHDIGALRYDEATYHGTSKEELERFLLEGKVEFVCGHNIVHHDAKYLFGQQSWHLVDTLYLSPLLFSERPYHRLPDIVKEYIALHWKSHAKLVGTIPPSTWRHEYAQPCLPWNKVGISSVAIMCHTYMPLESRIDYLADILGLSKKEIISAVERMRQEGTIFASNKTTPAMSS